MKKKKRMKKIVRMGKFERLLYTFTIVLLVITPFAVVFSQATLSKVNFDVEKVKKQISTQEKKNESLAMKVNELASGQVATNKTDIANLTTRVTSLEGTTFVEITETEIENMFK